jgi:Zn-dependent peptidase ImmA (M78 family)
MKYQTSLLEDWIDRLYIQLGIRSPDQLDFKIISERLRIPLDIRNLSSRIYEGEIIINSRLTPEEQWQEFGHELCHKLRHAGNQMFMPRPFFQLQEFQANYFAYHFCVPTFMLQKLDIPRSRQEAIYLIAVTFGVTCEFADKRLQMYEEKLHVLKCSETSQAFVSNSLNI